VAFDPFDTEESPDHPLYSGNPWFLPVAGGYYRLRDTLDRLLA
jgi:gamma-glutamylputrescine oxidase